MSDFQKITDAIRAFLAADERNWNDDLPDLSANYAAACRQANDRIRRCNEYLRRGMRSEAVHLADCQPNLADMAAALRFPESSEWAQICAANGLTVATPLVEDRADDLEEARALEKDLGPLLSQHRILSLARAPLLERLEVLSALADRDSENACWRQEIQLLETSRLEEIRELAVAAAEAGDSHRILELLASLKDRSWHGPVPEDLRDELQRTADEMAAAENSSAAGKLADELIAACEQADVDLALHLQGRWNELSRTLPLIARDQIRERIDPAIAWIDAAQNAVNPPDEAEPDSNDSTATAPALRNGKPEFGKFRLTPLALKCVAAGAVLAVIGAYFAIHRFVKP